LEGIEVLDKKIEELKVNAKFNGIKLQIEVGGEYLLDDDISDRIKNKQIKTFSDNFILIEFPMTNQPMGYEKWLFDLQLAGYNIILAHPERFLYFYEDKKQYLSLKDRGIYFQMNIGSISGYYGNKVKEVAEYLIKENMIDLVGSDCHGQRHIDAIKRTLRSPILKQLIESGKLINNKF
jgi:tyrosine-protein phosphatase YwqE